MNPEDVIIAPVVTEKSNDQINLYCKSSRKII